MQILPTDEEKATIAALLKDVSDIKANTQKILDLLQPKPDEIQWPYGNWENCKYTLPDASEVPALNIRKTDYQSPYIKFYGDGSITFNLPTGIDFGTTPNAKNPRIERREYKNMAAKSNYVKGDIVTRDFVTVFHKLNLGTSDVVFTQMHGEEDPYFKFVAGKKGIRVQCKTKEGLPGDDVVKQLLPHDQLGYEVPYRLNWKFDGTILDILINGTKTSIAFDRKDSYYPKDGAYGPLGVSLTHMSP